MSHELRTPLNSLLILSKLLADNPQGNLNEKQTEFARTIHGAGSDLLSLINDILDLSKIESGTVSIEVGDMPMSSLKQHMERTFRQLAADKNSSSTSSSTRPCRRTSHVPIHVISGADKLSKVMEMGAFGVTEKPADQGTLAGVFRDLAAQIGDAPLVEVLPDSHAAAATSTRAVPELAGAKILIVDDDIRNIYSLTSVLESYDVEVLHAERGKDGILILEQTPGIDIALIDIMMPEMDGYETMQQIRRRQQLSDLPLIAVTAKAMKGDRQKCLDAGASDYIAKPVDIDLLLALLRVWIARSREVARPIAPDRMKAAE
jgi:CheY-like chemotaxis protein